MRILFLILIIVFFSFNSFSTIYYASPIGINSNDGTISSPWDLQTALNNPNMTPNDTLYLLGGVYNGRYTSRLNAGTVRSNPNEWAKIDGYYTTSLQFPIDNTTQTIIINGSFIFESAQTISINNTEIIQISQYLGNNTYLVNRGWAGTTPTSHSANSTIVLLGNILNVQGNNTTFRDIEVYDSNPNRVFFNTGFGGYLRSGEGVNVSGDNLRFINMIVHDCLDGFFIGQNADNTEVYGVITYNNGHVASDRSHGHGFYIQNQAPSIKTIKQIISFNNYAMGIKGFGETGKVENLIFQEVVSFNNGSPAYFLGNPTPFPNDVDRRWGNLLIGANDNPSDNITIKNSYLYHKPGTIAELGGLSLGRFQGGGNSNLIVQNNYIAESQNTLFVDRWNNINLTGNTFYLSFPNNLDILVNAVNPTGNIIWNNNKYYGIFGNRQCIGGELKAPFYLSAITSNCGVFHTFNSWQSISGFDSNSNYLESVPPNSIFITPNQYESGRSHIIVYNWNLNDTINVDLSQTGLVQGQFYQIKNVQNLNSSPVVTGFYNVGTNITIPMNNLTVEPPIGSSFTPESTAPRFAVFIVFPQPLPTTSNITVNGIVTSKSGESFSRATVKFISGDNVYTTTTNSLGNYSLTLPSGTYVATATYRNLTSESVVRSINDNTNINFIIN